MSDHTTARAPRRVVFVLQEGLHLLDLAGPAQAFASAGDFSAGYDLRYVSEHDGVLSAQGLFAATDTEWPPLRAADLVIVPGWRTTGAAVRHGLSGETLGRLREHHARGGMVASVCSGAVALGDAGLLDERRFTTHHQIADAVASRHPRARLVRDVLFVVDDRVGTSAGIASGIDLALRFVADDYGSLVSAQVARSMLIYTRRNGDEPQASAMLRHRAHLSDVVHTAQDIIDRRFAESLPLPELAAECGVSERTLARLFVTATGLTPLRYQQALRLEHAERLIGQGEAVEAAAHSVGFADARMLRRLRARPARRAAHR